MIPSNGLPGLPAELSQRVSFPGLAVPRSCSWYALRRQRIGDSSNSVILQPADEVLLRRLRLIPYRSPFPATRHS